MTQILEKPTVATSEPKDEVAQLPHYSIEEFMSLDLPDNGNYYELVKGAIVEVAHAGDEHGRTLSVISRNLDNYVFQNKLGLVYLPTSFTINAQAATVRIPDLAFLSKERLQPKVKGAVPVPPDLAVEVISPSDKWSEIIEKIGEYQEAGVKLVWLVDPNSQVVFVYGASKATVQPLKPTVLGLSDELDGGEVVPGFKLSVGCFLMSSTKNVVARIVRSLC